MRFVVKIVGGLLLLALLVLAGGVADFVFDEGRIADRLLGRDRIEASCLPELTRTLVERGYTPSDIEFGSRTSLGFASGRGGTLTETFTFTDGPGGIRVDGAMACAVAGPTVRVEVRTTSLPRRAA